MRLFPILIGLGVAAMGNALWFVFEYAPIEARMGVIQKIFYFHVASAWLSYVGYLMAFIGSIVYLYGKGDKADLVAQTGAEIGVLFGLIVVITGPLWARPVWGVWWRWDPRLTTMALTVLVFGAYVVLRSYGGGGEGVRRFAAVLAVFGAPNIYFVHFAVKKWRGVHPDVVKGGGLASEMWTAMWFTVAALGLVFWMLAHIRYRANRDARNARVLRRRLARMGGLS